MYQITSEIVKIVGESFVLHRPVFCSCRHEVIVLAWGVCHRNDTLKN